jgi:ADP-ribosyl-[dinitrogen reductase] hydrolase
VTRALKFGGGGHWKVAPGQITDDGELILTLLKSLLDVEDGASVDALPQGSGTFDADRIAANYVTWVASEPFDIGETLQMTLGSMQTNEAAQMEAVTVGISAALRSVARSSAPNSQSNGSLMRISPLALFGHKLSDEELLKCAEREISLTHSHPVSVLTSQVYLLLLVQLIRSGGDRMGSFHHARDWLQSLVANESTDAARKAAVRTVAQWMDAAAQLDVSVSSSAPKGKSKAMRDASAEFFGIPDKIGWCKVAFSAALKCLLGTYSDSADDSYKSALRWVLAGGGDTDTNAAIVGAVMGAAVGFQQLPPDWVDAVLKSNCKLGSRMRPARFNPSNVLDLVPALLWVAPEKLEPFSTKSSAKKKRSIDTNLVSLVADAHDKSWGDTCPSPVLLLKDQDMELGRRCPENAALSADKRLSRKHVIVRWDGSQVRLTVEGRNGCAIAKAGSSSEMNTVASAEKASLKVGDTICLLPDGNYRLKVVADLTNEDVGDDLDSPPPAKRRRLDDTAASTDDISLVKAVLPDTSDEMAAAAIREANGNVDRAIEILLTEPDRLKEAAPEQSATPVLSENLNLSLGAASDSDDRIELRRIISKLRHTINSGDDNNSSASNLLAKLSAQVDALETEKKRLKAESDNQEAVIALMKQERADAVAQLSEAKRRQIKIEDEQRIYVPGEREAMAAGKFKTFSLYPTRQINHDAASMHFRTAESQFYRLLGSSYGVKVTKVEYIVNPKLIQDFEQRRLELAAEMPDWDSTRPIFVFHGTSEKNIDNIIKNNFDVKKVGSSTDAGFYGAGLYFSELPSLSMGYVRGCTKFLLCQSSLVKILILGFLSIFVC